MRRYLSEEYHSNSWLIKIASNGRVLAAPTVDGRVFLFNLVDGTVATVLKSHEDREVRDVLFHKSRPVYISCGDDGCAHVYDLRAD